MALTTGWALTGDALDRLLHALDPDRDAAGQHYERLRARLVRFFDLRGSWLADENADETMNRIARKLAAGEAIRDVPSFAIGVARLVLKESARADQGRVPIEGDVAAEPIAPAPRADCMDRCLDQLREPERQLILNYYVGERRVKIERRRELSRRLDVPLNGLRIRAFRIRQQLERCVVGCLGATQEQRG